MAKTHTKQIHWQPSDLIAILDQEYGSVEAQPNGDPISELVLTLLSQNTSDHNSGKAFHQLLACFKSWDAVIAASTAEVENAIRPGGLHRTKAPRMQQLLTEVRDLTPDYSLNFLAKLPLDEAKAWLQALPGVGPKTAAIVLLFALGRPALPVDTHVERVTKRLGLIPPKMPVDKAHAALEAQIKPDEVYSFHVDLIQHGRRTCHARSPKCESCVLLEHCPRVGLAPFVEDGP